MSQSDHVMAVPNRIITEFKIERSVLRNNCFVLHPDDGCILSTLHGSSNGTGKI